MYGDNYYATGYVSYARSIFMPKYSWMDAHDERLRKKPTKKIEERLVCIAMPEQARRCSTLISHSVG